MANQSKYNRSKFDAHVTLFNKRIKGIRYKGKKKILSIRKKF